METMLYRSVEPMLHKIVELIHKNYGDLLDKEELFGEACLLFTKACRSFQQGKATFRGWVWLKVYQGLLDVRREAIKKKLPRVGLDNLPKPLQSRPLSFAESMTKGLSEDARMLLGVCLENRKVRFAKSDDKKGKLFDVLQGLGWAWDRITGAFLEVKEAIA